MAGVGLKTDWTACLKSLGSFVLNQALDQPPGESSGGYILAIMLLNILINELNEWPESTLSKHADDPKLGGILDRAPRWFCSPSEMSSEAGEIGRGVWSWSSTGPAPESGIFRCTIAGWRLICWNSAWHPGASHADQEATVCPRGKVSHQPCRKHQTQNELIQVLVEGRKGKPTKASKRKNMVTEPCFSKDIFLFLHFLICQFKSLGGSICIHVYWISLSLKSGWVTVNNTPYPLCLPCNICVSFMNDRELFMPHFNTPLFWTLAGAIFIALNLICFYEIIFLQDHTFICILEGYLIFINIYILFFSQCLLNG